MAPQNRFSNEQVLAAIQGSGGIMDVVAKRLGCAWETARKRVHRSPKLLEAFNNEVESTVDLAESILVRNMMLARRKQEQTGQPVDSLDAKWWLAKRRGTVYADKVDVTTGGQPLLSPVEEMDDARVRQYLASLAKVSLALSSRDEPDRDTQDPD